MVKAEKFDHREDDHGVHGMSFAKKFGKAVVRAGDVLLGTAQKNFEILTVLITVLFLILCGGLATDPSLGYMIMTGVVAILMSASVIWTSHEVILLRGELDNMETAFRLQNKNIEDLTRQLHRAKVENIQARRQAMHVVRSKESV